MIKIAFYNKKGGVGKTTSVLNVAGILAKRGKKVVVVDTDGQGNSTSKLLSENDKYKKGVSPTLIDYFNNEATAHDIVYQALIKTRSNAHAKYHGIDVIACDARISFMQVDYDMMNALFEKLDRLPNGKKRPEEGKNRPYDIALIDYSPYMGENTIAFLSTMDYVIIPVTADSMAQDGMVELKQTLDRLRVDEINDVKIIGVFLTDVHMNESYDRYIYDDCKENLGELFIPTAIRHSTFAKQSVHFGTPLCWLKPTIEVTKDYEKVADYILDRI